MKTFLRRMGRFLTAEDGPTAVEYAVMLALIVVVCLSAVKTVGTNAKTAFSNVGSSLASAAASNLLVESAVPRFLSDGSDVFRPLSAD